MLLFDPLMGEEEVEGEAQRFCPCDQLLASAVECSLIATQHYPSLEAVQLIKMLLLSFLLFVADLLLLPLLLLLLLLQVVVAGYLLQWRGREGLDENAEEEMV
jgi:hypothetical protein